LQNLCFNTIVEKLLVQVLNFYLLFVSFCKTNQKKKIKKFLSMEKGINKSKFNRLLLLCDAIFAKVKSFFNKSIFYVFCAFKINLFHHCC